MARATYLIQFSPWVTLGISTLRFNLADERQELTDVLDMYYSAFRVLALIIPPNSMKTN